jgi:type IV pilus assembly protein PilQ
MRVFDSRKFLSVGVLLLISTLAVNGASSKDTTVVKDVTFNSSGESLEVKITTSERAHFTYFELKSPQRLVVDFHGTQNDINFREKPVAAAGVERVRTSLFTDHERQVTRIVFDLRRDVPYRVVDNGAGIVRVLFNEQTSNRAPLNLTAGPPVVPRNIPPAEPILVAIKPSVVTQSEPAVAAAIEPAAEPNVAPVRVPVTVEAPQELPNNTPGIMLSAATVNPAQISVAPQQASQAPISTTPTATPQYTGEIISLDLKDVDVKDFFRLIGEISGLNIVLDPNVTGTLTLLLKDVPWDQALDVVLKNYQFGAQLQGNVLRIATSATLQTEENNRKTLRQAQDEAVDLSTRTFILNYTKADVVGATLTRLLSTRGSIIQDVRRNALIVSDIPSQFGKLDQMVQFLDTPSQQVEIEARVLSANKSFSRGLGNQIGLLIGQKGGSVLTGAPNTSSPFIRNPAPRVSTGGGVPLIANFPAAATSGLSFLLGAGGDIILDEIITAAEARGTARIISRPRVMTQNNQPATISNGTQIPVQSSVNNTVSVQFLNFSLRLTVTPQITEAGTILLTVAIENSQPDFAKAVNGIPSVSTQQAQTQVLIPDGGTAVIGGILVDTDRVNVTQVPGLGSIPVVGNLFKSTQTLKSTDELIFFITSRIKPPDTVSILSPPAGEPQRQ